MLRFGQVTSKVQIIKMIERDEKTWEKQNFKIYFTPIFNKNNFTDVIQI